MFHAVEDEHREELSLFAQIKQKGINILWQNRKAKSIFILLVANIINNLAVFVINVVAARKFGPDNFGIFSLAAATMVTIQLTADLGLNLSIVRFYNIYQNDEEQQYLLFLSLLLFKLSMVFVIILVSLPLALMVLKIFRLEGIHTLLFTLAIASAGIFNLWLYCQSYMQAHRQFKKLATYIAFSGVLRIVCFFAIYLLFARYLNLSSTLTSIYTWPLIIAIIVALFPIMTDLFTQKLPGFKLILANIAKVLHYGKWVAISALFNSFIYRGVQFILAARTSTYEVGIFSAGFVFTLAFSPINAAIRTVFFPYVTAYAKNEAIDHLRRMKKVFPSFLVFTAIGIAALAIIQIVFLGDRYTRALPVFLITATALTISVFLGIASMLVHTIMKPEIDAYTNIGRVIVSSLLIFSLAPVLGALGGALAYALPIVLGEIFMVLYVRKLIYERE